LSDHNGVYVAGYLTNEEGFERFSLYTLDHDGNPKAGFGNHGLVEVPFSEGHDRALAIAIQSDGKILVAGESHRLPDSSAIAVGRVTPDGSLDPSFNLSGMKTIFLENRVTTATAMLVQPDGKILVAGESRDGNDYDIILARLNP